MNKESVNGDATVGNDLELHLKYRPQQLEDVVGQEDAVAQLTKMLAANDVPHAITLQGPPGTGKTTLARIMARELGATGTDLQVINCASCDPMDTARSLKNSAAAKPLLGKSRVWICEEVQALSRAGFAQQALLLLLEHPPRHAYFILCTTDPSKIIKAIQSRCTSLALSPVADKELRALVADVVKKEGEDPLETDVLDQLIEVAEGSPRQALVLLGKVLRLNGAAAQLECLKRGEPARRQAIELARMLIRKDSKWPDVAKLLKALETEDHEQLRRMVLGYASSVLLGGKDSGRCFQLLCAFENDFFTSGRAGLVRACYEVYKDR